LATVDLSAEVAVKWRRAPNHRLVLYRLRCRLCTVLTLLYFSGKFSLKVAQFYKCLIDFINQ